MSARAALPVRSGRERPGPGIRQITLVLEPDLTAPRRARDELREVLTGWGLGYLSADAQSIASELVTNAILREAPTDTEPCPVILWISATNGELLIRVWDPDPAMPEPGQPLPKNDDEHGRGLFLVASLASQWGTHPDPNGGKFVWATLRPGALRHERPLERNEGPTGHALHSLSGPPNNQASNREETGE